MSFDFGNSNKQQIEAIGNTEGPLLIIAGPGTGKTYTLVKRIVYLITEKNIKPEEIMVATFTEKAAKELITRVINELLEIGLSVDVNEMYIGTFHSICLRILKEHLEYTRIKKNYRMLDSFDQQYIIFQNINQFRKIPSFDLLFTSMKSSWMQAASIAKYVNNLTEELVDTVDMFKSYNKKIVVISQILNLYCSIIDEENLIDFSSIQTETYRLLINHSNILEEIRKQIKYIMVDEYQDTNYIQELIVFLLAGERKNICVVGDDDQGLYRFRGATIRNILEFPQHFHKGECKRVDLTINYRSEKDIIDFYNKWMSTTKGKFSWGDFRFYKNIIPGKKNYREDATVVKCSGNGSLDNWFERIYDFIVSLKGNRLLTDYNQVAFLCKSVKNNKIIELINYLEERGLNVYSPRSELFFQRQEIKEAIGCLLLCFPAYLQKLKEDMFEYDFKELYEYYKEDCMKAAKGLITKHPDTLGLWLKGKMKSHAIIMDNTDYAFAGLLYQLFEFEPFRTYLSIDLTEGVTDTRPARNISILTSVLGKYEYLQRIEVFTKKNIVDAVERFFNMYMRFLYSGGITEYEDDSEYAPSGCISFMTIHQSKGMEFPVVLVDSLNGIPKKDSDELLEEIENNFFHRRVFETREDIKYFDFWRLYYTSFSRAQNLLVLTCCEKSGRGATPSKYFEDFYRDLPEYDDIDLTSFRFEKVKPVNIKEAYSFTSHISLYENCAKQYKFFKELGFAQVRVGATLFGTLVHETIEDIHRAAIRKEEITITPENIKVWFESNYNTLSKSEHSYLGQGQLEVAYKQVLQYAKSNKNDWSKIQDAEVEVSLVKSDYILQGTVDLIRGNGNTVEIVDFKSEKKPDIIIETEKLNRYRRQLEIYAHLIEEKIGKEVSKMHLYYTGEDSGVPTISFVKSKDTIDGTVKEFDKVVEKIKKKDFNSRAKDKNLCANCDMRHYCKN